MTLRIPSSNRSSSSVHAMAKSDQPITIKKYANRRLYNTGTSTYVTLEDLAVHGEGGRGFRRPRRQDRRGHHPLGADPDHLRAGEQGGAESASHHLPAPAHPLLWRQHADAGAALSRSLDRLAHPRAGKVSKPDGAGFRRQSVRRARGSGAPEHGDVRARVCHVHAVRTARGNGRRRDRDEASRSRAAAATRSTISSARWKRCRSDSNA